MKNQNKKKNQERELDKVFRRIFSIKIVKFIKEDLAFIILSFGIGSISYFYLINYLQRNIFVKVKSYLENIDNINNIQLNNTGYLLVGFIFVILSVLFLNKSEKTKSLILLFILSIVFGMIGITAVIISQNKLFLFSIVLLLSIVVLIYILINVFRNIYNWLKIDKSKDKQIDVAKLTFVWGIIIFLYSLLK
jgi:hypothetical protein